MKKMKKMLELFMVLVVSLSLVACAANNVGSSNGSTTQGVAASDEQTDAAANEELFISVILKTTSSEYWGYVVAGAEAYMADHPNVKVEVKGPSSETAYDEQQNMIETDMNNPDIDGYVIAPLQADMVATMITGQSKPVVAVDTNIDAPEILSFVGTGNEAAAKLGGEAAVALAKERGWTEINCIEIAGVQGDASNEARMKGYMAGVEAAGGDFLENEVQYANAVADQAVTCMEAIMQNHPEGVAIICANNDDMAMAAARTAAGNEAYANTVFMGFDGIQSACNSILAGELTMSVCQEGYSMGYSSVDAVVRALRGEKLDKFIDSGASIVDPDTAQQRLEKLQGYLE
ncbi:MAG: sugar ABC transporter substrate-binding protein [Lachnospiraceae bacterium]|nr:sugar ABC transporter substrate-binding protein [Lachnospiraceae bacterium]MDY3221794.1 sugar ABC transporter substrate-binding protein [Lachnospiraceae bacterium]